MKLDGKFYGLIVKNKDQSIVPQDQWIVFLATDNALPATLNFYREECLRQGAAPAQFDAVTELYGRLLKWRKENLSSCKTPDVDLGEIQI